MRAEGPLLLALLLTAPAAAEVTVRVLPAAPGAAQQVELTARAAPLAEVLDRLGRQIGMKVLYEGAHPRQLVTLSLQGRSPVETVLGVLEGQGLNYALVSDTAGTRVETLLIAGAPPQAASSGSAGSSATRGTAPSSFRRPVAPPPGSGPDSIDEPDELEEDEAFDEPVVEGPEAADAPADPGQANPGAAPQAPQAPGQQPSAPSPSFPVSPFAPQATPYTPQPFPPVPPGAPVATPTQPEPPTTPPPGR